MRKVTHYMDRMELDEVGMTLSSLEERGLIVWDRGEPCVTELGLLSYLVALENEQSIIEAVSSGITGKQS